MAGLLISCHYQLQAEMNVLKGAAHVSHAVVKCALRGVNLFRHIWHKILFSGPQCRFHMHTAGFSDAVLPLLLSKELRVLYIH